MLSRTALDLTITLYVPLRPIKGRFRNNLKYFLQQNHEKRTLGGGGVIKVYRGNT